MADEQKPSNALPERWIVVNEVNEDGALEKPYDALPEGWIAATNEAIQDGPLEYYTNSLRQQEFYAKENMYNYIAYATAADLPQAEDMEQPVEVRCTRCRFFGHNAPDCFLSEQIIRSFNLESPPFRRGLSNNKKTSYKCSRCGHHGHNVRTCHASPIKY